jgi:hypothetical protein
LSFTGTNSIGGGVGGSIRPTRGTGSPVRYV